MSLYNVDAELLAFARPEDLQKCKAFAEGASEESKAAIRDIRDQGIENGRAGSTNTYMCVAIALSDGTEDVRSGIPSSTGRVDGQRPGFEQNSTFEDLRDQELVQSVRNPSDVNGDNLDDPNQYSDPNDPNLGFFDNTLASLTIARPTTIDRETFSRIRKDNFTERITRNLKISRNLSGGEILSFERLFTTNKFLLQSVTSPRAEKFQVIETFDAPVSYLFGERHEIYTFSGVLIDTQEYKWKKEFIDVYNQALRATRCVELGASAFLTYLDDTVEGFVINAAFQESVSMYGALTFTFSMLVKKRKKFSSLRVLEERQISQDEVVNALVNVRGVREAIEFMANLDTAEPIGAEATAS
jgi:hypothetical protein